ncbi:biotin-dependent carboxyltransferase family protein [Aestuariibius sp. HNIBRBA575]|uniref:5-oxoprolinase subunit C family protein n=1 Tax=Aestuariibius sp. HNIBRBA575 TaxID=3233343 RepID=UPI0034A35090
MKLRIDRAGPLMTLQDLGRNGYVGQGLSRGGAADRLALFEAAALLGRKDVTPAIEMAGMGGAFSVDQAVQFALTGAPMGATIDGAPVAWNTSYVLLPGQVLTLGGVQKGVYGYLTFAPDLLDATWLGSASVHLQAGVGRVLAGGDVLTFADAADPGSSMTLQADNRFQGGNIRVMPGPQTDLFDADMQARFGATDFVRGAQANRQGVRIEQNGAPFGTALAAGLASDFIRPGDIQMTGEGVPYVLLAESQTMGGYPRIGTVIAADLPRIAQAPVGAKLSFDWVSLDQADALAQSDANVLRSLRSKVQTLLRDPADIADLLSYQLISGVSAGHDEMDLT